MFSKFKIVSTMFYILFYSIVSEMYLCFNFKLFVNYIIIRILINTILKFHNNFKTAF